MPRSMFLATAGNPCLGSHTWLQPHATWGSLWVRWIWPMFGVALKLQHAPWGEVIRPGALVDLLAALNEPACTCILSMLHHAM